MSKIKARYALLALLLPCLSSINAQPEDFEYNPSNFSAVFIGTVQLNSDVPEAGTWIAAFDPSGQCAGANELVFFNNQAYANLTIYGDDVNTLDIDEGLLQGDFFTLMLYTPSNGHIIDYQVEGIPVQLEGWVNNNGAPIPAYSDETVIYDFEYIDLSYEVLLTSPSCHNSGDGQITIVTAGGAPPYSIIWNTGADTFSINGLSGGIYNCTISDASGQVLTTDDIVLDAPDSISIDITTGLDTCSSGLGSIHATVSGGTAPFLYNWSTNDTSPSIDQLASDTYQLTITDANDCTNFTDVFVPFSEDVSVNVSISNVLCYGEATGEATITVLSGSPPYEYNWSTGNQTASQTDLPAGTYFVSVEDAYGCQSSDTITISEPELLDTQTASTPETNGEMNGTATVSVAGGTLPYTYTWNDPLTQTTPEAINLSAGEYYVTILDANNCEIIDSVLVDLITNNQHESPIAFSLSVFPNPATTDVIYLERSNNKVDLNSLLLLDQSGRIIHQFSLPKNNDLTTKLSLNKIPPGTYILTSREGLFEPVVISIL